MNLTQKITLSLGLLAASVSYAQTSVAPSTGLLGQQYTELSLGVQDIRHVHENGYSLNVGANTALIPGKLDGGASYSYSWIRGPFKGHANTIGGYTNAYLPLNGGVKPFVGAGLGYQWTSGRGGSDDQAIWGLATGVEIPAGVVTITPRISYADDFKGTRESSQAWNYDVEANYWVNKTNAVFVSAGKSDLQHSKYDSWNFVVGLRARF